jgi:hypothetical protein
VRESSFSLALRLEKENARAYVYKFLEEALSKNNSCYQE